MSKFKSPRPGWYAFWCPGCQENHSVYTRPQDSPRWDFNGDMDNPTFSPSIHITSGHYSAHAKGDDCWCNFKERFPDEGDPPFKCGICHSFVRDGKIQFLNDCTHGLAGKTVELPEVDS